MRPYVWAAVAALSCTCLTTGFATAQPTAARGLPADPVAVEPLHNDVCHALAPAGWRTAGWKVVDRDRRSATFSVASADGGMMAAYGVIGISGAEVAGYYGPQYRRPALFAQYLAETVVGKRIAVTGSHKFNGMTAIDFEGDMKRGFVLYRAVKSPYDPRGYVISLRIAVGPDTDEVPVAGAVASSIDCNTAFTALPSGFAQVRAKAPAIGISKSCKAGRCDETDLAGTYSAQLGTGYVHSASGENYLVDVASDYRATGPNGPGYYRQNGNNLEKLEPGLSD